MKARNAATAKRNKAIAAIHIARQQLRLDEETYRAIVRRISGLHGAEVESSARCNDRQRGALLDELQRLGANTPGAKKPAHFPGKPHNFSSSAMPELIVKIEAQLADMGLPWDYADAIAKRQWGVEKVAWVRDPEKLKGIIAALHTEQRKRSSNEFIDRAVRELGMSEKDLAALTGRLPDKWRRQVRPLEQVCTHLAARLDMLRQKERGSLASTEEES